MENQKDILTLIEEEITKAACRIKGVMGDFPSEPLTFLYFIRSMGWDIVIDDQQVASVQSSPQDVMDYAKGLSTGAGEGTIHYAALFLGMSDFIAKLNLQLAPGWEVAAFQEEFSRVFPRQLVDYLLAGYLEDNHPGIYHVLSLMGFIDTDYQAPMPPYRTGYLKNDIKWDRLFTMLTNPQNLPEQVFGWGTANFDSSRLFSMLRDLMATFRIPAYHLKFDREIEDTVANRLDIDQYSLCIPFIEREELQVGFLLYPIAANNQDQNNAGLAVSPYVTDSGQGEIEITDSFHLTMEGDLKLDKTMGLIVKPDKDSTSGFDIDPFTLDPAGTVSGGMKVVLGFKGEQKTILLGSPQGARFEVGQASLGIFINLNPKDIGMELALEGASLVICPGEADGFLRKILPSTPIQINFSLVAGISNKKGFYLRLNDTPGLEITLPMKTNIGDILAIDSFYFALEPKQTTLRNVIALSAGVKLGPFIASIHRLGLALDWKLMDDNSGNLGPVDLRMGFKSPDGVGLALDAGVVTGGGYLGYHEASRGYEGVLQLKLVEIGITGICLIATRMPDGSDGFSMLIILCVEFFPPIQLSFGFTLSGIGGLVGVNRTMAVEALREGLRNRALDSILFPTDPIRNASKIVSDLRTVMPPGEGRFVFGPMVKIGWGTPNIITADIGIFIELPDPVRIVLLGQIAAALPCEDNALISLHIDVLGVIDFGKKLLAIDSTIYDSRILNYTLTGDAALRLSWGDNPCFIMALGGFHPRFTPPAGFPALRRLTLNLGVGDDFQLYSKIYLALTSNSLQFGSETGLYARLGGALIQGNLSFDTLIYFSPFSFTVELNGYVTVRYKGHRLAAVYIYMGLSGPAPWNARVEASFEVLWWQVPINFNLSWGESHQESLPAVDPLIPLNKALNQRQSWGVIQPSSTAEIIRAQESMDDDQIILHPAGRLEIRQNVLPFGIRLQKLGNAPVKDHDLIEIREIRLNTNPIAFSPIEEDFAIGQYRELTENERMTLPSFEKMPAGAVIGFQTLKKNGEKRSVTLDHQTIRITENGTVFTDESWDGPMEPNRMFSRISPGMPRPEIRTATPGVPRKTIGSTGYIITRKADLKPVDLGPGQPANDGSLNRIKADQTLEEYLRLHPEAAGKLQIIPGYEAAI